MNLWQLHAPFSMNNYFWNADECEGQEYHSMNQNAKLIWQNFRDQWQSRRQQGNFILIIKN